jgi:serine/threonine protein kinase
MKVLGQGQFGKVCLGVSKKTDAMVAYKEMNKHKNSNTIEKIANEIYIMRKVNSLCSPNLVELISVVERPQFIYIVMEALDGGELFYRIQKKNQQKTKYSESDAACFMRTIAGAVKSLHDVGIVHRDLKPENLIFRTKAEDSELVIIDFGLAWDMKGIRPDPYEHRAVGTPGYLAPEFIKAHEDSFHVTKASDVFSLGVILYILLVGFPPFTLGACKSHKSHAIATAKMYKKMLNEKYELKKWGWRFISDSAKSLVVSMLRGDPSERPSIDEVLSHEWFNRQRKSKQILNTTIERIRKFNVCRKWRKAVRAIVMMNRLQSLVSESSCIPRKEKNITLSSSSSSSSSSSKSVIVVKRRRRE